MGAEPVRIIKGSALTRSEIVGAWMKDGYRESELVWVANGYRLELKVMRMGGFCEMPVKYDSQR